MKIALLVPAMDTGGVEQGTYDLACGFAERGHTVLVISGGGYYIPGLLARGIHWESVPMEKKNPVALTQAINRVKKLLYREKPDIVHCRSRLPAWVAVLSSHTIRQNTSVPDATRKKPPHLITSIHGFHRHCFYSRILARGERVIIVSAGLKDYATRFLGVQPERLRLVYNGFDFTPFLSLPPKKRKEPGEIIVLGAVGRLTKNKGIAYLIKALHQLQPDFPFLQLQIVGEGPEKKTLQALTAHLGLTERVLFLKGRASEFLANFDILIAPHLTPETMTEYGPFWPGRAAVEAQVASIPVVTTLGGLKEGRIMVQQGIVFAPVADPAGLAAGIRYLLTHPEEKKSLVEEAKRVALKNFSLPMMVEKTLAVYREVV